MGFGKQLGAIARRVNEWMQDDSPSWPSGTARMNPENFLHWLAHPQLRRWTKWVFAGTVIFFVEAQLAVSLFGGSSLAAQRFFSDVIPLIALVGTLMLVIHKVSSALSLAGSPDRLRQ